jgi:hypothetical protein
MTTWNLSEYLEWKESGCEINESIVCLKFFDEYKEPFVNQKLNLQNLPNLCEIYIEELIDVQIQ